MTLRTTLTRFLLLLAFASAYPQESINFSLRYRPEKQYTQTISQSYKVHFTYDGSTESLKQLKEQGTEAPKGMEGSNVTSVIIKTGKLKADRSFPVTVAYENVPMVEGRKIIPAGTVIHGHATERKPLVFDSITTVGMDKKFKENMLDIMSTTLNQITYPDDKTLKVGESVTQEIPLNLPIPGISAAMNFRIVYTLTRIDGHLAYFDITQTYEMESATLQNEMRASGSGSGKMVCDTRQGFFHLMETQSSLQLDLGKSGGAGDDLRLNCIMEIGQKYEVVISDL